MSGAITTTVRPTEDYQGVGRIILNPAVVFNIPENISFEEWLLKAAKIINSQGGVKGSFGSVHEREDYPQTTVIFRYAEQTPSVEINNSTMNAIGNITPDVKPREPGPSTWGDETCPVARAIRAQSEGLQQPALVR